MFKRFFLTIIILALLIGGLYFATRTLINSKRQGEQVSQTISEQIATSSTDQGGQEGSGENIPNSTTVVPSSWLTHSFSQQGSDRQSSSTMSFSITYPSDLVANNISNASSSEIVLAFPKEKYFHWPLQDDARITITASSSCVDLTIPKSPEIATSTFSLNGYSYSVMRGGDVGAGNLYHEVLYTTEVNNQCYSFSFFDHGSNGAGLYVDDQALIQRYDSQHSTDFSQAMSIFNAIIASFRSVL